MNIIHAGFYLIILKDGIVSSYDGSHSRTKGVTQARELINRIGLGTGSEYKMLHLKKDVSYEGKMLDKLQELHAEGKLPLVDVKNQKVKINTKAADLMAGVIASSRNL